MVVTPAAGVFLATTAVAAVVIVWLLIDRSRCATQAARNAAMLRAVPDLMFLQTRDGVYLDFHAFDTSVLLAPPEVFLGKNMRDVLPRHVLDIVEPMFDQLSKSDGPVVGEYPMEIAGETRFYEVRLFNHDDKVLTLVRDATERTRMAAALRASEERYALATMAGRAGVRLGRAPHAAHRYRDRARRRRRAEAPVHSPPTWKPHSTHVPRRSRPPTG